jgi:hypothetical protein
MPDLDLDLLAYVILLDLSIPYSLRIGTINCCFSTALYRKVLDSPTDA